ncbi:MAG: DUF11 domain-containing protein [Chloroflexi bacterium]|nr:DUF11 domain-containing protein [Chloroflexota bacterium]
MKNRHLRILFILGLGLILALLWLLKSPSVGRAAGPWYVAPDGDNDDDCLSTTTSCATINGALAKPGFVVSDTILVAMGTYTGDGGEVVLLDKSASLSGGWDDTFTTQSGASTIDGEGWRSGITVNSGVTVIIERFVVQNGSTGISCRGNLTLKDSSITDNASNGLYLYSSDTTLTNNIISDNAGDGLYLYYWTTATLTNNIIADNAGNGLYIEGSSARLLHTTIARNTGGGNGVYVTRYCSMGCIYSTVALTNTILVSQTVGIFVETDNTATLEGTLWGNGSWANDTDWGGDGTIITGTVNLWDDPDFVDPYNGDYHIGPDSAAFDTGVTTDVDDDIDSEPRPQGSGYDIGADERADTILRLRKAVWPLTLNPGETLTYTLDITSTGAEAATGVWLTDTLPTLQRAVAITTTHGSCTAGAGWGDTTTCDLGTIASGDSAHITFTAQVTTTPPAQLPVSMRNTAWVTATETMSRSAYVDTTLHDCHVRLNDSPIEYETVQAAVDASTQPADIVKVAGTCTGVTSRDGLTQIAYLSKTLTLQGGWNTAFTQRNVTSFPTTLDAQEQGRVLYITAPAPGTGISPTVEGLRIIGGNAAGLGGDTACALWCYDVDAGGGIYIITATATISNNQVFNNTSDEGAGNGLYLKDSDATIINNTITNNPPEGDEGAGLYLKDSDATIINNTITNNHEGGLHLEGSDATIISNTITNNEGGGLHLKGSDATIISNTISNNTAGDGGGLYLEGSDATLSGNTISSNTATDWGDNNGGGLCLIFSNATLSDNTVISNTADGSGGGVYLGIGSDATLSGNTVISNTANGSGGGVCLEDTDNATLSGNTVISNTANDSGGGMYLKDSGATIINNTISNNTANNSGGGMYLESSGPTIRGNTISNNTSNGECGGLYLNSNDTTLTNNIVADNQANAGGSGLCLRGSSIYLLHNTVAHNTGGDGSGVYVFDYWGSSTVALTNTILVSHTVGVHVAEGSTVTLESTLWGSGAWANESDCAGDGTVVTGTINLWDDPDFVNPTSGDYHIGAGSLAVDAGIASGITVDIDGDPRPAAFGYDIGADERTGASLRLHKDVWPSGLNTGQTFTYTLVITDVGANTATHVQLIDTLPALQRAVDITSSQGSCVVGTGWGGVSTCDLGTLAPGYSAHVTLTAQVTTTPPAQLLWLMRNTAWVTATETTSHTAYADTSICHVRLNDSPIKYGSIQAAVDASTQSGDVVKVAGYCTGVTSRAGVAQIVYVDKTLTLQGGWNTTFTQRNVISFPTTLDAQGQGRVLYVTAPAPGAGISSTVEGLRITGGDADGLGGGPYEWEHAGGGVYVISATAIIRDNQVFNNTAIFFGGGLYLRSSDATLSRNTVTLNTTTNQYVGGGGGLYLEDCVATLQGNTVSTNTVTGQSSDGGGLFLDDGTATLNGNTISSNTSNGHGGGVHGEGTLIGNTVTSNTAYGNGGGVHGGGTLIGNIISGNTADQGGGLFLEGGDATLTNNVIADNQANNNGSGLYIQSASARLLHTTIARNTGGDGSGMHIGDGSAVLTNTILVSHTVGVYVANGEAKLEGTLWGSGAWANETDWDGDGTIITGTVDLWGDPAFVNPDARDYHITLDSAAVDAGVDAGVPDDMDGDPRTDGYPDIGADELSMSALVITKQAEPDPVQSGGQLTYTIHITNTGTMTLTATVIDTLPDNITQGQTPGGTLIVPSGTLTWTPVIIVPKDVWSYTFAVTVELGYAGPLTNVVQVTTVEGATGIYAKVSTAFIVLPNQAPYTPTNPIPIDGASDIPITQTLSWQGGDPDIGDTVTYTIAINTSGQPPVVDTTTLTSYTPSLITGNIYYWVITATDGISMVVGPTWSFTTTAAIAEKPIVGLAATNDSPTHLGQPTILTATVTTGTHVAYTWAFGDEETASGDVVTHIYQYAGVYTALVTATNSINTVTTTTVVTVVATIPPSGGSVTPSPGITITILGGTFTDTVVIHYAKQPVTDTGSLKNVGLFYKLHGTCLSNGLPAQLSPGQRYTITVTYQQEDVPPEVNEADLALYYWDGNAWMEEPTSIVDAEANTITATPDHFSLWAALSEQQHFIYLPLVLRNH